MARCSGSLSPRQNFLPTGVEALKLTEGGVLDCTGGSFSADGVDLASALLVDALPEKAGVRGRRSGGGWGFLSAHALTRPGYQKPICCRGRGIWRLKCARRNVTDDRASFHWEDATSWEPPHRLDGVIMNPPFHIGRAAEPQIGQAFVATAARILSPQGKLWMVANRHLPYEAEFENPFRPCRGNRRRCAVLNCFTRHGPCASVGRLAAAD